MQVEQLEEVLQTTLDCITGLHAASALGGQQEHQGCIHAAPCRSSLAHVNSGLLHT
jgi:hypothetical protein